MLESSIVEKSSQILWHRVVEGLTRMTAATGELELAEAIEENTLELSNAEVCCFFTVDRVKEKIIFETTSSIFREVVRTDEIRKFLVWLQAQPNSRLIENVRQLDWPLTTNAYLKAQSGPAVIFHNQIL